MAVPGRKDERITHKKMAWPKLTLGSCFVQKPKGQSCTDMYIYIYYICILYIYMINMCVCVSHFGHSNFTIISAVYHSKRVVYAMIRVRSWHSLPPC